MTHLSKNIISLAAAALLAAAVEACYPTTAYFHYFGTDERGWEGDSVLQYHVPHVDEAGYYVEEIGVRTSARYPFRQLSLVVEQSVISVPMTHGRKNYTDTVTIDIYGDDGRQHGKGVGTKLHTFALKGLNLQEGDSVSMRIHHNMRRYALEGVTDVGLRLTQTGE